MPESSSVEFSINPENVEQSTSISSDQRRLLEIISESNKFSEWYKGNETLKNRQEKIILSLPENFIDRLEKHLTEGIEAAKRHGKLNEFNDFNYIKGEMFEIIIEIEEEEFDLFPGSERYPQTERDSKAAKLLLDVLQNPTKYGLMQRSLSNPDKMKLVLENGTYTIKESIEAKTNIDSRTYKQLGRKGFRRSFQEIIDEINGISDLEKFGLGEFETYGINIGVALDYIQKLVIPRDFTISKEGIGHDKKLKDYEVNDFYKILTSENNVVVGRSAFSNIELRNMTQWALEEIYLRQKRKETEAKVDNN